MPKVSVIVPNYNHARFLRQRIDTILAQTFQDFELILLDDYSTDDSRSILSSYSGNPHVSAVQFNEKNSGSTFKQWNKGVRLARGEYVWIAESDDYADPRFLERLVAVLDAESQVVFVNCRSWRVHEDGRVDGYADSYLSELDAEKWTRDFEADGHGECRNYLVFLNTVCTASSVLFRRSSYEAIGGADESLRFCGDWKLWAAMALTGRVSYLSEPLNQHRAHKGTVTDESKRQGLAAAEYLRVVRWLLQHISPTESTLKRVRDELSWLWIPPMVRGQVSFSRRLQILRNAIAVDPRALRRVLPPMFAAVRIKVLRGCRLSREKA